MPYKVVKRKAFKRFHRKRVVKSKVPVMNSRVNKMPRGFFSLFNAINPFPVQWNGKFVYVSNDTLTSAAIQNITGALREYRLNSPFDPDYTTVAPVPSNTQPYAFAKLCGVTGPYTKYKVNACKIELLWTNPSADGLAGVSHIKSYGDSFAISAVDLQYLERQPMTSVKRLNDTGSQRRKVIQYVPGHQMHGWTKLQYKVDFDTSAGLYNGNPTSDPRLQLCVANTSTSAVHSIQYRLKLTFYTTLFGRYTQES